jgi:uncharacterized protein (TIGR02246 family)
MVLCLLPLLMVGCATEPAPEVDLAAEAQAIRDLDVALSEAAQARDAAAFAAFFSEDIVQMPPDAPPIHGRAELHAGAAGLLEGAGADLRFENLDVKVASSGDMAVSRGMWYLTIETPEGPVPDEGSYIEVWEKVDGRWQITWDIYNRDLPEENRMN